MTRLIEEIRITDILTVHILLPWEAIANRGNECYGAQCAFGENSHFLAIDCFGVWACGWLSIECGYRIPVWVTFQLNGVRS